MHNLPQPTPATKADGDSEHPDVVLDVAVIGAGLSGLYALHRFREAGLRVRAFDEAAAVGGTWWWNRYPGARVDSPGAPFYCYTFSEEMVRDWTWTETQPDQPTILAYLNFMADRFDLRRDIELSTRVTAAHFNESHRQWRLATSTGRRVAARFLVTAVGTLSAAYKPDIPGLEDFAGEIYHTGHWPQDRDVEFSGKTVGVIGTGSSGVQVIPIIAEQADQLTVFQRTPQFVLPANNRPLPDELLETARGDWAGIRRRLRETGRPLPLSKRSALEDTPEQRRQTYEAAWHTGGMTVRESYRDHMTDPRANELVADFVRSKIREIVQDPDIADQLLPDYLFGTKRLILGTGYYETYNRNNVTLVNLRKDPIEELTSEGVQTSSGLHRLDTLVLATGYDAITGALLSLNPTGRSGLTLQEKWAEGARTYLGLGMTGFPNLFVVHGPQTPSVKFHIALGAELQVDWIADCIAYMAEHGLSTVEPKATVESAWGDEVSEIANQTLYPRTDSWYTGANIPGKPRQFAVHLAGPQYHERLRQIAADNYTGFVFRNERDDHDRVGPE